MAQVPPTLKKGAKGDGVKSLQNALRARGYDPGAVDGAFGGGTEKAVREFQEASSLEVDGIAGPQTWQSLGVYVVQPGDTLRKIAEHELGDPERWSELYEANDDLIDDPHTIHPGQIFVVPGAC
jgi:nucleoid-associated protein YgaU